nr:VWA domain-containing protein [Chitinophagaceae bacterium]
MNRGKKKYQKVIITIGIFFCIPFFLFGQSVKKSRILFLLDASSSMTYQWNPKYSRFDIASNILLKIIDSVYALNNEVEFAVRAYGTQFPAQEKNCTDTRLEVPFNIQNVAQINTRLKNIKPIGFSPIAYSLKQASENELMDARLYDYSIIFITDGGESCNGDVCNTFKEFIEKKIKVKPYIIGLDRNEQLNLLYDCMGNFIKVSDSADIDKAVKMIVDANRPLLEKPKVMNLPTVFANPPVIKDTDLATPAVPVVKLVKSKSIFPRLRMVPYTIKVNDKIIFKPAYIIQVKASSITLKMNFEEEKPIPAFVKKTDVFPKIIAAKYKGTTAAKSVLKPKELASNNNAKAILRFQFEEPLTRNTDIFPFLRPARYTNKKAENKAVIVAKSRPYDKGKKATLRFDVEEPLVRNTDIFPFLRPIKYSYKKTENKVVLAAKSRAYDKGKKATLRFEVEEPVKRVSNIMPRLSMQKYASTKTAASLKSPKSITFNTKQKAILRFEIEEKKKGVLGTLKVDKYPMRYSYAYRLPQIPPRQPNKGVGILRFSDDDMGIVVKKKDTSSKPKVIKPIEKADTEFEVAVENSQETKVQVFFEGRNGKKYPNATPEIVFKDAGTKSVVSSFRRAVEAGIPVPQNMTAGKYNVVVVGYNDLYLNNVTILPNKLNKITIQVTDGTLSFAYVGNRARPVEYNAVVNRRFAAGATVLQKCTDKLPFEPGTYYVEIATLPASKFSIDMSFGALYELQIPEPGTLQITNSKPVGTIQLQYEHGDKFEVFYSKVLTGSLSTQTIELQPGKYKIIYPKNPNLPQMGSNILDFRIKSNQNTMLELE